METDSKEKNVNAISRNDSMKSVDDNETAVGKRTVIYTESVRMLEDMEDWVEIRMDDKKEWLQARILIHKVFEARFLLSKAWTSSDMDELNYIHDIVQRVWHLYDPNGMFEQRVRQAKGMLRYVREDVYDKCEGDEERKKLEDKVEEGCFLVERAMNKRDDVQLEYIWNVIRRMCLAYQVRYAPYRDGKTLSPGKMKVRDNSKRWGSGVVEVN